MLKLRVSAIRYEAQGIYAFDLVDPGGAPLPAFEAGAHLDIRTPVSYTHLDGYKRLVMAYLFLGLLALVSAGLVGMNLAAANRSGWMHQVVYALVMTSALYLSLIHI